jgi:hypothetical protein
MSIYNLKFLILIIFLPGVKVTPEPAGTARSIPIKPTNYPVVKAGEGFKTEPICKVIV